MRFPLTVPGMEGHQIEVATKALGLSPQLLIDDFPAPTGQKKGEWLIYRPDGTMIPVLLTGSPLDIVPRVFVNGRIMALTEPLQWHEWLLICLPLILLFLGLAGAVLGAVAAIANVYFIRSSSPSHVRSLSALGVTFAAFLIVLPLGVIAHRHRAEAPPVSDIAQSKSSPLSFFHRHHHPVAAPIIPPADAPAAP